MKKEKQELVMCILAQGKYKVDAESGIIYSWRSGKALFEVLRPTVLPGGYLQYVLWLGRGMGSRVVVYGHVLVWMSVHGKYEEGMVMNHKDLDKKNNAIGNLELVSQKENIAHALKNVKYKETGVSRTIRHEEISQIKDMLARGIKNHSRIARELGLGRLAVRYTIKNIEAGKDLKYETAESCKFKYKTI